MLKINNHLIDQIIEIAESKQASDLILLDVSPDCDFADLFIIMDVGRAVAQGPISELSEALVNEHLTI